MDSHDVTDEYFGMIKRQKETLKEAQKRQGQRPQDRKPREYMYMNFMLALSLAQRKEEGHLIHSSFVPPAYSPCTTPVTKLKQITIRDLRLETHHRGSYLLLRCITPPNRMTAIIVLAEDENDDVMTLQVYQQQDEEIRPATDTLNVGIVVLLKEPYFKIMGDGEYGLRVDHLSDIVQLRRNDARIPLDWQTRVMEINQSAESLKQNGNQAMKEGRFWDSITIYSDALLQPTVGDEADVIKRNRSLAYLRTKQFDAALSDTGFPNFDENSPEKAMFRASEALYNLKLFDECCQLLDALCSRYPSNDLARVASNRARNRLREQKEGEYNFKLLQAEAKKIRPPHLDHATYIGSVEIRQTASKGRGLFTTKAVKAGDLLLCEKAFAHAYASDESDKEVAGSSKISLLINTDTDKGVMGTQADLLKTIVQKVYHNPSLAPAFTALHHGDYMGHGTASVDGIPIVDTFLVERIISLNSFGCPLSSLDSHTAIRNHSGKLEKSHHSCGIWIIASYINHSCISNARRAFIGDMMVVRASRDLKADTEISFPYHRPDATNHKDIQKKLKQWGFECQCAMCVDIKSTPAPTLRKRGVLRENLKKAFKSPSSSDGQVQKIERLLEELNETYSKPADLVPRLLVWDLQLLLARRYASRNKPKASIAAAGKVLKSLGFVITGTDSTQTPFEIKKWGMVVDELMEAFMLLGDEFAGVGAVRNSERAEGYARTAYKMLVGEDMSFDSVWGRRLSDFVYCSVLLDWLGIGQRCHD